MRVESISKNDYVPSFTNGVSHKNNKTHAILDRSNQSSSAAQTIEHNLIDSRYQMTRNSIHSNKTEDINRVIRNKPLNKKEMSEYYSEKPRPPGLASNVSDDVLKHL
jgi:hypothetical protein